MSSTGRARAASPGRRRLIVTGDDFGLAPEVNRGITRAYRTGILTSTSLMVAGPAMRDAVELAHATPGLAVGLHLVLVQGRATSPGAEAAGLALAGGAFRNSAIPAALHFFFRPGLRRALAVEVRAQLEAFRATGLTLSHVDGHLNIHLHPVVQNLLADLADEFAIPAVRVTRDPIAENLRYDRRHAFRKIFEGGCFRILAAIAERRFRARGIATADHLYGLHQSGACDERYLCHLIPRLPAGDSELYCHPAESQTPEMARLMPGYVHSSELAALVSPAVRAAVEQAGVELATYADLRGSSAPGARRSRPA